MNHLDHLRALVTLCEDEFGCEICRDEPDDEAVSMSARGPSALTFGHIRRARAALDAFVYPVDIAALPSARDVLAERHRQQVEEGFTTLIDDCNNINGVLIRAAICYAFGAFIYTYRNSEIPKSWFELDFMMTWWPWTRRRWKPTTARRMLVKAAALIIAEIERIDRAAAQKARAEEQRAHMAAREEKSS